MLDEGTVYDWDKGLDIHLLFAYNFFIHNFHEFITNHIQNLQLVSMYCICY
jgi:hypothetical protein